MEDFSQTLKKKRSEQKKHREQALKLQNQIDRLNNRNFRDIDWMNANFSPESLRFLSAEIDELMLINNDLLFFLKRFCQTTVGVIEFLENNKMHRKSDCINVVNHRFSAVLDEVRRYLEAEYGERV